MSRPERLRRSADVVDVLRRGRRRSGRHLVVHARRAAAPTPRVAVVASRRVGGAVQRNRAKRLLREASATVALPGVDLVLVARPSILEHGAAAVTADLVEVLEGWTVEQMFDEVPA